MKRTLHYFISSVVLLVMTTSFFNNVSGQVLNTESFDATQFLPPGWTPVGSITAWSRQTNGTNPTVNAPHSGSGMARFNRNAQPNTQQTFSSPVVDYSNRGVDTPRVSFWIYRDSGAPNIADYISIYVNTSPNLTGAFQIGTVARYRLFHIPDSTTADGWYQYTSGFNGLFDIPASFNTTTNYLLFLGANAATQGNNIFIDDIQYTSYPTPCTGSPTPGIIVPTDTMICGGGGSTLLSLSGQSTDNGITIQWYSGSSATGPWTSFGPSATSVSTGPLTTLTYYYAVLTCSNSALSDSTPVVHVTVDPSPPPVVNVTASNNGYSCIGAPVTLIATGATTYTWSPATGLDTIAGDTVFASVVGNAGDTTWYVATGTNASGCKDIDSIPVIRHSTTNVTIQATPNDTVCSGQNLALNAVPGGGPFVTGYLWMPGGSTNQSITLTPTADSTYTVQATNNWGCRSTDSIHIHVTTGSLPIITSLTANPANAIYCIGGPPVTLAVAGTGFTTITWSPANGLDTTSGDTVLAAPPMGFGGQIIYTVTLTSASGCSDFDTIRVRRAQRPNLNMTVTSDSVCAGDSTTLNAQSFGFGLTWLWSPGGATTQAITVAPSTSTPYNVHITGANGCTRDSTVQITVSSGPTAAFTDSIVGRTVTFYNNSVNGASYEWHFGDGNLSFSTNPQYTYSHNGTYTAILIVRNGACTPDTAFAIFTVTLVGIEEVNGPDIISLSPNPVENSAIIEFRSEHTVSLQVMNSLGEIVSERIINSAGSAVHRETIDMSKFPAGVYMIHIRSSQKNISRKLVKL